MNEPDLFACPECRTPLPEKYRILSEVVCPTCGQQVCITGIFVAGVTAPGHPPAKVQLSETYWLPIPPMPGRLPDKVDTRTVKRKKSDESRPRDRAHLQNKWRQFKMALKDCDTQMQAALEITHENKKAAEALLRQFRRYRHFLQAGE